MKFINKNTSQQVRNQNVKTASNRGLIIYLMKSTSPDEKERKLNIIPAPKWFNSRWHSPKASMIKYDSNYNIIDIPEEYQDYIRKKLIKLWMNRSSCKKFESRNNHTLYHNLSLNLSLSRNSPSEANLTSRNTEKYKTKENSCISQKSIFGKRKSTYKSLSKILVEKEVKRRVDTDLVGNVPL